MTPEAIAALLRSELHERLKDVRPAFEAAALALCRALELSKPYDAKSLAV